MEAERRALATWCHKENMVLSDCSLSFTIHTILGFLYQLEDGGHLSNLASRIIMWKIKALKCKSKRLSKLCSGDCFLPQMLWHLYQKA